MPAHGQDKRRCTIISTVFNTGNRRSSLHKDMAISIAVVIKKGYLLVRYIYSGFCTYSSQNLLMTGTTVYCNTVHCGLKLNIVHLTITIDPSLTVLQASSLGNIFNSKGTPSLSVLWCFQIVSPQINILHCTSMYRKPCKSSQEYPRRQCTVSPGAAGYCNDPAVRRESWDILWSSRTLPRLMDLTSYQLKAGQLLHQEMKNVL